MRSLTPVYDITFIFNKGIYQPKEQHCIMTRWKTYDITKYDLIVFVYEEGIRNSKCIMDEVGTIVALFRVSALKRCVKEEWINIVYACISKNFWEYDTKNIKSQ